MKMIRLGLSVAMLLCGGMAIFVYILFCFLIGYSFVN